MNEDKLKQAYNKMTPDIQTEKRILGKILMREEHFLDKKFTSQPIKSSRWAAIPAVFALIAVITLGMFVIDRFGQSNQAMNAPDHEDQNGQVLAQESTEDDDKEQTLNPNVGQEHKPMILPEFGQPAGGCAPGDTDSMGAYSTICPLPETLDIDHLENCTVAVSLGNEPVFTSMGSSYPAEMKVSVYNYNVYDTEDIGQLEVGDTIVINQRDVVVLLLERDNYVVRINGGLRNGGYDLRTGENGAYYAADYSDTKIWHALGEVTLPVSQDFVFTDSADTENQSTTYTLDDLLEDDTLFDSTFTPDNTTIVIEDGVVTQMYRRYTS